MTLLRNARKEKEREMLEPLEGGLQWKEVWSLEVCLQKKILGTGKIAQRVKALATKPDDLRSISRSYMVI